MHHFLHFNKKALGKLFMLLAISCIVPGCSGEKETVSVLHPGANKETASQSSGKQRQNSSESETYTSSATLVSKQIQKTETAMKHTASGTVLSENITRSNAIDTSSNNKVKRFKTAERDPFALPVEPQEQQLLSRKQQQIARQIQQGYMESTSEGNRSVYGYGILSESKLITNRNSQQSTTGSARSAPLFSSEPCVAGIFDNGKEKFALVRWQHIQGIFQTGEALGNGYYVKEITANSVCLCPEQNSSGNGILTLTLK